MRITKIGIPFKIIALILGWYWFGWQMGLVILLLVIEINWEVQ